MGIYNSRQTSSKLGDVVNHEVEEVEEVEEEKFAETKSYNN